MSVLRLKDYDTTERLRAASNALSEARGRWQGGAYASEVLHIIREAEAHLAVAKARLQLHAGD